MSAQPGLAEEFALLDPEFALGRGVMSDRFVKMHGLGNDFVVIDARHAPVPMDAMRARAVADRHFGIGCDQLILIEACPGADARLRFFNADGGEVEACGNGSRAAAAYLASLTPGAIGIVHRVETLGGPLTLQHDGEGAIVTLPPPRRAWSEIPLAYPLDTAALPLAWGPFANPIAVNVGNPHLIFFVDTIDLAAIRDHAPDILADPVFPQGVNVNFARLDGPRRIELRTWERGAGLTLACGTGACATVVAAWSTRRLHDPQSADPVTVVMPAGTLAIGWDVATPNSPIVMRGPVAEVFVGETDWGRFPLAKSPDAGTEA